MKKKINEEMRVHETWYTEANAIKSIKELSLFIKKLTTKYQHSYGTICHAMTAAAIAAISTINNSEQGGITGFQASCVLGEFMSRFYFTHNKCGLRILDYDKMLYPQYEEYFQKTISKHTFQVMQEECRNNIKDNQDAHERVIRHWESIAAGIVPFGFVVLDEEEENN